MVCSVPFRPHYRVCWETRENDITVIQVRGDQSRKRAKSIGGSSKDWFYTSTIGGETKSEAGSVGSLWK